MHNDTKEYNYRRINLKYAPLFKLQVSLSEILSPSNPMGYLQWDLLERV